MNVGEECLSAKAQINEHYEKMRLRALLAFLKSLTRKK